MPPLDGQPRPADHGDHLALTLRRLAESAVNYYSELGLVDPRDFWGEFGGGSGIYGLMGIPAPPTYYLNQKRGEIQSVAINWQQLILAQARSRKLCAENEIAICAVDNRINYTVGEGLSYQAVPAAGAPPNFTARWLPAVQRVLDLFAAANQLDELEADVVMRCDRDGEAFLRTFGRPGGLLVTRTVEPEHVRAPAGDTYDDRHSWGVETEFGDVESVTGYWIVEDPTRRPEPHFVDAADVLHFKRNTARNAKRGLPTFYPIESNIRRAGDLLQSMTSMAKARAKLAMIRKLKDNTPAASAQQLADGLTTVSATDPQTGLTANMERFAYGTILNASANLEYEFPDSKISAGDYVAIVECELSFIAARLCMPLWMLLSHASDSNFASSLVAEAPSTKNFLRMQRFYRSRFGENRHPGPAQALAWRQLRHAIRCGVLPAEVLRWIDVQTEAPSVVVRDQQGEAAADQVYNGMRVKSRQTIQLEQGLDPETEEANFRAEAAAGQPPLQAPAPGAQGGSEQQRDGGARPPGPGGPMREAEHDVSGEPRDAGGQWTAGGGKSAPAKTNKTTGDAGTYAEPPTPHHAAPAVFAHARQLAQHKIAGAPVPTREAVAKARAELAKARAGEGRAGGESRGGSANDRRRQRENLFREFGGAEHGHCACPHCGVKLHPDPPPGSGLQRLERGKIFTKHQGGGYQLPNLLPECFDCNRSRNDAAVRPENRK